MDDRRRARSCWQRRKQESVAANVTTVRRRVGRPSAAFSRGACRTGTGAHLYSSVSSTNNRMPLHLGALKRRLVDAFCLRSASLSSRIPRIHILRRSFATHPSTHIPMANSFGNFDLIRHDTIDYADLTISRWKSRVTGLTVIHLDYEGASVVHLRNDIPDTYSCCSSYC